MSKLEHINALKGETLTNSEILDILINLKPDGAEQDKLIGKLISTIWKTKAKVINDSIGDYLKLLAFDEIIDKQVRKVYDGYASWCKDEGVTIKSKIEFSRRVCSNFNVEVTVRKIDKESVRVYTV